MPFSFLWPGYAAMIWMAGVWGSNSSRGLTAVREAIRVFNSGPADFMRSGILVREATLTAEVIVDERPDTPPTGCFPDPDPPKPRVHGDPLDLLTQEILKSVRVRPTVALWLIDASMSLKSRRNLVAERFKEIELEVSKLDAPKSAGLSTVVASFGQDYHLLTKEPVTDLNAATAAVLGIKDDKSGKEKVFAAVKNLVSSFHQLKDENGGQNLLLFIVTDERGDDSELLEESMTLCREHGIPVSVMGNGCLLGRDEGFLLWKYDDGTEEAIRVDSGPESCEPELVLLHTFGGRDADLHLSSGFGPFSLSRLCKATGGTFTIFEESAKATRFRPYMARAYTPDYLSLAEYQAELERSPCKKSVVAAAKLSRKKINEIMLPPVAFRADTNDHLKESLTLAQKPLAVVNAHVEELLTLLREGEKDRPDVNERRWRAAYDVSIGRCLALKARCLTYQEMLAEMQGAPKVFRTEGSNQWKLEPDKQFIPSNAVKALEAQARAYLKRCVDDHSDTPWALLAERDLRTPMGWMWKEATAKVRP